MSPEAQRIAIAEFCGWTQIEDRSERLMMAPGFSVVGYPPKGALIGKKEPLPDYLNDLNAMHEAEGGLNLSLVVKYNELLAKACDTLHAVFSKPDSPQGWVFFATAAQRAEALLKVTGKWKD